MCQSARVQTARQTRVAAQWGPPHSQSMRQNARRYIPFSGGPRKCVGDQFALMEAVVALSVIIKNYDFQLVPNQVRGRVGVWVWVCRRGTDGQGRPHARSVRRVLMCSSVPARPTGPLSSSFTALCCADDRDDHGRHHPHHQRAVHECQGARAAAGARGGCCLEQVCVRVCVLQIT